MSVLVKIRWSSAEEGGRVAPPPGPRYSTVARFESQSEAEWKRESWSLVLDLQSSLDERSCQIALVRFLAKENTPDDWLAQGKTFDLFEGTRKVAEGEVLPGVNENRC